MAYPPQGMPPGYTQTRAGYLDELATANIPEDIDALIEAQHHLTNIFPEDSSRICTVTAGGTNNTFGAWVELADSLATTLSSKCAINPQHVTGVQIEDLTEDEVYFLELAYGSAKTVILRHRFLKGSTKKTTLVAFVRIRARIIPAGETVYYRMMCSLASQTCEVAFRHHTHVH